MSNEVALPFAAILKAAAALPVETGESARYRERHGASGAGTQVILCDVSGSMAFSAGARRRIDHLREALEQVTEPGHILIAFSSSARRIANPADLPAPSGGTALEIGLSEAARYDPGATLVISDGEPTNPDAALAAAETLPGVIDVIYCGSESNREAMEFMRRLARLGCGRVVVHGWEPRPTQAPLALTMRRLLRGPRI